MLDLKKITRCSLWIILGLLALVAVVHLILPFVVNTSLVKENIRARVQAAVNGQFDYANAKPGILPRPHVAIINTRLSIPDKIEVSAASLSVSLRLLHLLTGKVQIATLSVQSPVVAVQFPAATPSDAVPEQQMTRDAFKEKADAVMGAITGHIKDGRLLVKNGRLALMRDADQIMMEELDLELAEADGVLHMEAQGRSSAIDQFSAKARIDHTSLDGSGRFEASGVRPVQLMAAWLPEKKIAIPDADLDLGLTFETQGLETWRMDLNASIAELPLSRDGGHVVQQVELNSTLSVTPDQVDITLSRLDIKTPKVQLSGSLQWQFGSDQKDAVLQATLQADTIDLTAARQTLISLMDNTPLYLDIIRGGTVSNLHFASQAGSWSGLLDVDNMVISGGVTKGSIRIPEPELDLSDVSGRVAFARGTLESDQASARLGASTASLRRLTIDLMAKPIALDLKVDLDADLTPVPDLVKNLIDAEKILDQLEAMAITQGRAVGTLALSGDLDHLEVTVDARDISLTLEDHRLPSALTLTGDQLNYTANAVVFKRFGARMQGSSLSRLSGELRWDPQPIIDLRDGGADLICQEIYPLLKSALGKPLPANAPKTLAGRIVVANAAIHGPLANPRQWHFKAGGNLKEIQSETDIIPGPVTIHAGKFDITPHGIDVSDLTMQWLDAILDISAGVNEYQTESPLINLKSLKGDVGDRAARWIQQRFDLASEMRTHTPVSIKTARGRWHRDDGVQLQADLMWPGDLNISLALSAGSREYKLDHLRFSDDLSDASVALRYNSEAGLLDLLFKGHLAKASLAKLWQRDEFLPGGMDGDFSASIKIDAPRQSVLRGQVDARGLILPIPGLEPVTIMEARLSGNDRILDIQNLDLEWLQQQLQLSGKVNFSGDIFQLNLALQSDALDLTRVKKALTRNDPKQEPSTTLPQKPQPKFQGHVNMDIGRLKYDHYIFQPLQGDLIIQEDSAVFNVTQASLCGLTTEGRIEWTPQDLSIELRPIATGQTLQYTGECLSDIPSTERHQGAFEMDGLLSTRGQDQADLIRNLNGHLQINITDGRIQNAGTAGTVTNLLGYLSLNNIISGGTPDSGSNDFLYNSFSLKIDVNQGLMTLNEALLNSNSINIVAEGAIDLPSEHLDLNVLVSPLTTVDSVVSRIPIVGNILQGTLVAVPVRVRGHPSDPDVIPLSPGAVGSRITGILKRTLQAPFQIISPDKTGSNGTSNQESNGSEGEETNTP